MNKQLTVALFITLFLFTSTVYAAEDAVSENIQVYSGEGNLTVTLVRMLPLDSNFALVKISGVDHELNGLVIRHILNQRGVDRIFNTQLYGRSINTLYETTDWGSKSMKLYLYGQRGAKHIYFDRDASKEAKPDQLLKDYKDQLANGSLDKVQNFNRIAEINSNNSELFEIQNNTEKACGKNIEMSIDWDSVTNDMIKSISVVGYCSNVFENVRSSCGNGDTEKSWVKQSIDSVSCEFSDRLKLQLVDKELKFKTSVNSANQRDFVRYNLLNIM